MTSLLSHQFKGYTLTHQLIDDHHLIEASNNEWSQLGSMEWSHKSGEIKDIQVNDEHQRQGLATAMYNYANKLSSSDKSVTKPKHAKSLTDEGKAWAKSLKKK